ncbi:MAG: hypothetical protein Q7T62_09925 [Undibacterium sp.]|nr:hypothetical protein [Undibacterium sp.]
MSSKIPVTKQQLIDIANTEFVKEPSYKPHLKVIDVRNFGSSILFEVLTESAEDQLSVLNSQEFSNRLSEKYVLLD